jgi:hypothetical protein
MPATRPTEIEMKLTEADVVWTPVQEGGPDAGAIRVEKRAPEDIAEIKKSETDETERDRLIRPKRRMF